MADDELALVADSSSCCSNAHGQAEPVAAKPGRDRRAAARLRRAVAEPDDEEASQKNGEIAADRGHEQGDGHDGGAGDDDQPFVLAVEEITDEQEREQRRGAIGGDQQAGLGGREVKLLLQEAGERGEPEHDERGGRLRRGRGAEHQPAVRGFGRCGGLWFIVARCVVPVGSLRDQKPPRQSPIGVFASLTIRFPYFLSTNETATKRP
jgi:hypothetical protein